MKGFDIEGFATLTDVIAETQALSDMELKAYLNSLSEAQQANFIAENITSTVNNVKGVKAQRYNDITAQLVSADNNITQAGYYLARTQDLTNLAKDVDEVAARQASASTTNQELATRQHEINEWSNGNKLDTLFFLQVLFVTLTLCATFLFLAMMGLMPMYLFGLFAFILFVGALLVLLFRWRFSSVVRNPRYWNKMKFPPPAPPAAA